MRIALLGPLEVRDDTGAPVEIAGIRLRTLLARLALSPGRRVPAEALIDAVWPDEPPAGATNALQSLVSRLRRALPAGERTRLQSRPAGYLLSLALDETDVGRLEALVAAGRTARDGDGDGDGDGGSEGLALAARRFAEALALWRGEPLADLETAGFAAVAARLIELRLRTIEDLAEVRLDLGDTGDLVSELEELTAAHPFRERLWAARMRALCAVGRPSEALAAFEELRRTLAETLGTDPSPPVRELHLAILRGDLRPASAAPPERPARRTNLTVPLTGFVGREQELDRVGKLLDEARLVTLVGPGGAGKTRLAVELAAARVERHRDGAWIVELASVRDPAQIPAAVAAALGAREGGLPRPNPAEAEPHPPRGPVDRLAEALRDRELLVVLDNCEHVIDVCAQVADAVTGRCPGVRVLCTSREPLAITGETLYPVGPLRTPPADVTVDRAPDFPALRLFVQRASAVRPGFALTAGNLPTVAEVCRRLDGLPLAIELACARLRTLPIEEIAARLGNRFRLLTGGSRTALPRHQTLQAVVEWSWDLLGEPERILARRLAVFAGGTTPDSAEAVCADPVRLPREDVVGALASLTDKSLAELLEVPGAPPRYRMLETVRAYAAGVLAESGEAERIRRSHAVHFTDRAERAEPGLRGAGQLDHLGWLTREYDNLTTALRWAVDSGDAEQAVRLAAALGWFWNLRSAHHEAAAWLSEVLATASTSPDGAGDGRGVPRATLAIAHAYDAMHNFAVGDTERAVRSAMAATRLAEGEVTNHPAIALLVVLYRMHPSHPEPGGEQAVARLRELAGHSDPWLAAAARLFHGLALAAFGNAAGAAEHLAAARTGFGAVGDRWGEAAAVSALGTCRSLDGDHAGAISALTEAMRLLRELGSDGDIAGVLVERGLERVRAGDFAGAAADLERVRTGEAARRSSQMPALAEIGLGELARRSGDLARARSLLTGVLGRIAPVDGDARPIRARALIALGRVAAATGDLGSARAHLDDGLRLTLAVGDRSAIANAVEAQAELAIAAGEPAEAARLLGLATSVRGTADKGSPDVRRAETAARAALGDAHDAVYLAAAALGTDTALAALGPTA
ncbi:BTAD domain-containing putative transcriptional regulator [Microbispora rosea]|uniref:AfsR/SARP family transcriptional regulator n=1 Tax=Microbispora rosea TaxID=58117 RepID=UPI0036B0064A